MSILAEVSIFPMGTGESVGEAVAGAVALIRESGLDYKVGPMGTTLEGEWDEVMNVVGRCHQAMRSKHPRVYMTIKIDSREGGPGRLEEKVERVT
ncbi:MTH1187 family thiamine-binding protein [Desulfohalovibrio reitneri]|uniref:MTH1187 family thiamine-binding protein n=1 Tax=Desulfohalovibrio reitneri TaxID=1307759 RepID=UPI0004A7280A|nr:MTH1187 family thiamine-binding protein [Desulfohalovibrio reitneri]